MRTPCCARAEQRDERAAFSFNHLAASVSSVDAQ
jgi:hypothetical protein